jgi:hypothetical protein
LSRIHKVIAVGGSTALVALTLTPTVLAVGAAKQGVGRGLVRVARTYKGKTSKGKSISLTVGSGRVSGKVFWSASCGSAGTLKGTFTFKNVPVSSRSFSHKFKGTTPVSGYRDHWTAKIAGAVSKSKAKARGTFSDKNALLNSSSNIAQCNTGKLTWKATTS